MSSRTSTLASRRSTASITEDKNTVMRRQLAEFREKLETGAENFSTLTLHYWLKLLTEKPEISYQNKFINSLSHLHKLIDWVTGRYRGEHKPKAKDLEMLKYFEWFFGYVEYLRELCDSFDKRVFNPLFDYFFDDEEDFRDEDDDDDEDGDVNGKTIQDNGSHDSGLGHETMAIENAFMQPSASQVLVQLSREFSDVDFTLDNKELRATARELHDLVKKWRGVMAMDKDISAKLYSKESLEEVAKFHNVGHFRQFLRFVPDVLYKSRKALSLAEHWMDVDDRKMAEVDKQLQLVEEIQTRMEMRVINVLKKIQQHKQEFDLKSDELQMLLNREDRSNDLNVKLSFVKKEIDSLCDQLREMYREKDAIIYKLQRLKRERKEGTLEFEECTEKFEQNELHTNDLEKRLQLEKYKYRLVEEDMLLELEVKPSIVRYTNQVEDDCERIEQYLQEENALRRKLEKALKPLSLKTGRDVSEILKFVGSHTPLSLSRSTDLAVSSATSSRLPVYERHTELESVLEGDEVPLDGAVVDESPVPVEEQERDTLSPKRDTKKEDEGDKENILKTKLPVKEHPSTVAPPVKVQQKISNDSRPEKSRTERSKKAEQPKEKAIKTKDAVQKNKPNKTKNGKVVSKPTAKKPIVKPQKTRNNEAKKTPSPRRRVPAPANEPKVELPWYRRQNIVQKRTPRIPEPIRSRENLEWMYRNAAERQNNLEVGGVSGTNVRLHARSRPTIAALRNSTGLSYL